MARFKYWVDVAASNVRGHEVYGDAVEGTSVRTFRVYLNAFQDKHASPSVEERHGRVMIASGGWVDSFDATVEPFSTTPAADPEEFRWDAGQKMILLGMMKSRWKWITGSNLPRQSSFFLTLDGFRTTEITDHGLAVQYTSSNPLPIECSGWSEALDMRKGEEAVTINLTKRYQG